MSLASLLRHVGINVPNGVTIGGEPLPSALDAAPPGCTCDHGIGRHLGHGDGPYICEVDGCPCIGTVSVDAVEFIETARILAEPYDEDIASLRAQLAAALKGPLRILPDPRPACRHVAWLTGRAQALRLDADALDQATLNEIHSGRRTQLTERARMYRFAAIELDSLAAELGTADA